MGGVVGKHGGKCVKIGRSRGTQDICDRGRSMFTADTVCRKGRRQGLSFAFIYETKSSHGYGVCMDISQ